MHLNRELEEDVPGKVNLARYGRMHQSFIPNGMRIRKPYQGNRNVVCPEVEGEVEEDNLDAAAVEVLAVEGHQGAKEGIKGEYWDNNQSV